MLLIYVTGREKQHQPGKKFNQIKIIIMKKLFTLLFTFGILTTVSAQYNNDNRNSRSDRNDNNGNYSKSQQGSEVNGRNNDRKDYAYNDRRYNDAFSMSSRERDFKIAKISRDYDYRIGSVSADRYLRPRERNWQIQNLQRQKYDEIRSVQSCFNDSRNRYSDGRSNRW